MSVGTSVGSITLNVGAAVPVVGPARNLCAVCVAVADTYAVLAVNAAVPNVPPSCIPVPVVLLNTATLPDTVGDVPVTLPPLDGVIHLVPVPKDERTCPLLPALLELESFNVPANVRLVAVPLDAAT